MTTKATSVCANCGADIFGTAFCESCGTAVAAPEQTVSKTTVKKPRATKAAATAATELISPPPPPKADPEIKAEVKAETKTEVMTEANADAAAVAAPAPRAPRDRSAISRAAIRFAGTAYAIFLLSGLLGFFIVAFPFNPLISPMAFGATVLFAALALVAFVVAAVTSDAPIGVRALAVLLAAVGLAAAFFPYALYASPVLVFVAWALLARFRGWGYFALLLVAFGVAAQVFFGLGLLFNLIPDVGTVTLILIIWVAVQPLLLIAVVAAAKALERSHARAHEQLTTGAVS